MIKAGLGFSVFPYLPTLEEPGLRAFRCGASRSSRSVPI